MRTLVLQRAALAGALVSSLLASACRDAPAPASPATSRAEGAASAPASAAASGRASAPDLQPGARMYYGAQQTIEPPAELARFVPPGLEAKPVERNRGRGMELMRLASGRRFATLTLLTLASPDEALRALTAHAQGLGFSADPTTPAERALVHPDGERLALTVREVEGQPLRVMLRLTGPEAASLPATPEVGPEVGPGLGRLAVVGFEETLLHGIVPGGRVTDVSREALIVRAPSPAVRAEVLAGWEKALLAAGYVRDAKRSELWQRSATQETWLIRPTDDPAGDVLLSHQRRWRRG